MSCPFLRVAILMPSAVVNMFSMLASALIQILCTLQLTTEGQFCSNLVHTASRGSAGRGHGSRSGLRTGPWLHQSQRQHVKRGESQNHQNQPMRLAANEMH